MRNYLLIVALFLLISIEGIAASGLYQEIDDVIATRGARIATSTVTATLSVTCAYYEAIIILNAAVKMLFISFIF